MKKNLIVYYPIVYPKLYKETVWETIQSIHLEVYSTTESTLHELSLFYQ